MTYEHVTNLPFLLDSSYLTSEEIAERNANPTLFAAKRYGQPEHFFRSAAERHANGSLRSAHPEPATTHSRQSRDPTSPQLSEAGSFKSYSQNPQTRQSSQVQQVGTHSPFLSSGSSSPCGSSRSTSYFSTVLSDIRAEGSNQVHLKSLHSHDSNRGDKAVSPANTKQDKNSGTKP